MSNYYSLNYILKQIVCDTFENEVGRWQSKFDKQYAMLIEFSIPIDYENETGYRYRDLLIFGDCNYIGVWTRTRWILKDNDGESEWESLAYHDSCWRDDGVHKFFQLYGDQLNTISSLTTWYEKIEVTEKLAKTLKEARDKRRRRQA